MFSGTKCCSRKPEKILRTEKEKRGKKGKTEE
jgi:hypothetical protein